MNRDPSLFQISSRIHVDLSMETHQDTLKYALAYMSHCGICFADNIEYQNSQE